MAEYNGRYFITIETTTKKATSMLIQFHRYLIHFENRIKSNKISFNSNDCVGDLCRDFM